MSTFLVSYTSPPNPDAKLPEPQTPVNLDLAYVLHQAGQVQSERKITLNNTRGEPTEFKIHSVRHKLDSKGSVISYDLFLW